MFSEAIYALVGIALFGVISYFVMRKSPQEIEDRARKKNEIISRYKEELELELEDIKDDRRLSEARKNTLLKKFDDELCDVGFFNKKEIECMIFEVSSESEV